MISHAQESTDNIMLKEFRVSMKILAYNDRVRIYYYIGE